MKRFIMIFVSFCILIMICSCHQSLPELPNGGDTTVVNDPDAQETTGLPTQEGQAEETTAVVGVYCARRFYERILVIGKIFCRNVAMHQGVCVERKDS